MKLIVVAAAVVAVAARIFATVLVTDGSDAATIAQPSFVFLCLFVLIVLADAANGHAVLPAFILGLVMSRHYQQHREEQKRTRVVAFAFLTRSSSSRAA